MQTTEPTPPVASNGHARPPVPEPATLPPGADEAAAVMLGFQDLMAKFLLTQQSVMSSYLAGPSGDLSEPGCLPGQATGNSMPSTPQHAAGITRISHPGSNGSGGSSHNGRGGAPAAYRAPAADGPSAEQNGHAAVAARAAVAPAPVATDPGSLPGEATSNSAEPSPCGTPEVLDRETLTARLMDLVSERTGYPQEMLDLDLDLEGDLGIDSIKRVEILGSLAESIGAARDADGAGEMQSKLELEKLTAIRNLRGIIAYLDEALFSDLGAGSVDCAVTDGALSAAPGGAPSRNGKHAPGAGSRSIARHAEHSITSSSDGPPEQPATQPVSRGLVRLVDVPFSAGASMAIPSGALLVTDDERGIAVELADRLADFGQRVVLVRMRQGEHRSEDHDLFYADLTDEAEVERLVDRVGESAGPIAGLIHLMPLAARSGDEMPEVRARRDVKSLYLLARALGEELCEIGSSGSAMLIAPTALGGFLGYGDSELPATQPGCLPGEATCNIDNAGHGGILGFVKCLGMEWPDVLVRGVDVDADRPTAELVDILLGEMGEREGPLEVGHTGVSRVTWQPCEAPLDTTTESTLELEPGAVVLVTGGARGITAAIAEQLARRWKPRLVLVGRSPAPEAVEDPATASLTGAAQIKAALIEQAQREGRPPAPAKIESAFQKIMRDREIRDNLARIREAGADVHYYAVDVRDEAALSSLIDEIRDRFGSIAGVIHGAGVIEDKLVRDKTPDSFDRVFQTKVDSAMTFARKLDPESLKFCVFFASIASRYGNRGQSDYAAANEVLSKLAIELDRRWPCRVVSIAWGPWSGVGMVSDLEKHLAARGITLISPEEGPRFLIEELTHGRKGQSEVLIGGGSENVLRPHTAEAVAAR